MRNFSHTSIDGIAVEKYGVDDEYQEDNSLVCTYTWGMRIGLHGTASMAFNASTSMHEILYLNPS